MDIYCIYIDSTPVYLLLTQLLLLRLPINVNSFAQQVRFHQVIHLLIFLIYSHRCFSRSIRLCCVTTPERTPAPRVDMAMTIKEDMEQWFEQTRAMCAQSARQCLMLTPQDFITYLAPTESAAVAGVASAGCSLSLQSSIPSSSVSSHSSTNSFQFVVIDVRTEDDRLLGGE